MSSSAEQSLSIAVPDSWVDEFCEQVGSLCAVLQALARLDGHNRPHTLVGEALDNCAVLQDLLNAIPVSGGHHPSSVFAMANWPRSQPADNAELDSDSILAAVFVPLAVGDSFPEVGRVETDELPSVDAGRLHERCGEDVDRMLQRLQHFRDRAEGDLRELEMLSVGHDWTRLSRLAGVLKEAASQVSAARMVVDAAALQGAARVGCRNDVDLALDALRADLRGCTRQIEDWLTTGIVG